MASRAEREDTGGHSRPFLRAHTKILGGGAMRDPEQAREARARRKAQREGLALQKSRTRNPGVLDWGTYMLVDPDHNRVVAGPGMSLSEVEAALNE
jgi:hypothetical protein